MIKRPDTMDPDRKLDALEGAIRAYKADPSLWRRAGRIYRVKKYFLLHGREGDRPGSLIRILVSACPAEGKIVFCFIFSLFMLSILVTSWPILSWLTAPAHHLHLISPGLILIRFFTGILDFMAMMIPVILVIVMVGVIFSILSRLAAY